MMSQAHVATAHGSRYLQQLCKHWSHKFTVSFTPDAGTIDFGDGRRCELHAQSEALDVRAVAEGDLERLQTVIADHIRRFAFREELVFSWQRGEDA